MDNFNLKASSVTKIIVLTFLLFFFNTKAQHFPLTTHPKHFTTEKMNLYRSSCNNLDFAAGTTVGWKGAWCDSSHRSNFILLVDSLRTKGFNSSTSNNQALFVHEIMTAGTDPYAPISTVPPGHNYSLRLGNDSAIRELFKAPNSAYPYNHQMASNTFTVSAAHPTITYWHAVVFAHNKSMPHVQKEQPYVKISVFDKDQKKIACMNYDIDPTMGLYNGFKTKPIGASTEEEVIYKDWLPVYIPLIDYIGQQVTIQFESNDCSAGGHFGYVYLAVDCGSAPTVNIDAFNCKTDTVILTAPIGAAAYSWSGPGIIPPGNMQSVKVNASGLYTVKLLINKIDSCIFTLDTIVLLDKSQLMALFSNSIACVGKPTRFTNKSTVSSSLNDWYWDFNNDGIEDSREQHPTHVFNTPGNHAVKLKIKQGSCETEIIRNVLVNPGYTLIITNPIPDSADTFVDLTLPEVTAGSTAGASLSYWQDSTATISLANPTSIKISGTYFIKIGTDSCALIKPVVVTIGLIAVITANGNILNAPIAHKYQWFFNGDSIPGADSSIYRATRAGEYTVLITGLNGLQTMSKPYKLIITTIRETAAKTTLFTIYPNPTDEHIIIQTNKGVKITSLVMEIRNILGKQVYFYKNENSSNEFIKHVDLTALPKGIYFIRLKTSTADHIEKIILQ